MKLYIKFKFDKKIDMVNHFPNIYPGSCVIVCKDGRKFEANFDRYTGKKSDENDTILETTQKCLDVASFPKAVGLNEALKNGGFAYFEKFEIHNDNPGIRLVKVLTIYFELDDGTGFELHGAQLQQVNELIGLS